MVRKRNGFFVLMSGMLVAGMLTFSSCKEDDTPGPGDYDRAAMLSNVGQNIILPAYRGLKATVDSLDAAATAFQSVQDASTLQALRDAWWNVSLQWQRSAIFEFGPASMATLWAQVNTFPTDTAAIHANISSGTYDLEQVANLDAKGLPALDYLLFGTAASDVGVISVLSDAGYLQYLSDVVANLKMKIDQVVDGWEPSGGNYIATFTGATGTDVGSSTSNLVNQLNYEWELIKNNKVGIPLGKKTLGQILPEKAEAYFSGRSAELALENMRAVADLFAGRAVNGDDGFGLDDNLDQLGATYDAGPLSAAISQSFADAIAAMAAVPDPMAETIVNNPAVVETAYQKIQMHIVLIKADMTSALAVLITYQDTDGD